MSLLATRLALAAAAALVSFALTSVVLLIAGGAA